MKRRCKHYLNCCLPLAVFAAVIAASAHALADNWPFVRRDTSSSGVAESPLPQKLDVLWTYQAGGDAGFEATAIVDNQIIYVGDNEGTYHSVLVDDGRGVWKREFEDTAFLAGAAFDEGTLYVGDANGAVRALSIEDGHELWNTEIEGEVYAGPMAHGEDVLVTCEAGSLTCFDTADGKKRWNFKIEAPLRCTPTIAAGQI